MTEVADTPQRREALDAARSFCVSAPAGSGKTELLIQRYLRLLARVERPEQILAITFTRKAAAEMRERILEALQDALAQTPIASPHQQLTRDLAQAALKAGLQRDWDLLQNFDQFNIKTIDSFCASLTAQMPVLSQLGGSLRVEEDAEPLYREAVRQLFEEIDGPADYVEDLSELMLHFGNDWDRLATLLIELLQRREQWRDYVGVHHRSDESERFLIITLEQLVSEILSDVAGYLMPYESELLDLQRYSAANLGQPLLESFPEASPAQLPQWQLLPALLLTAKGQWRSKLDVRMGFPASGEGAVEHKAAMQALLGELRQIPGLDQLLVRVTQLPQLRSGSDAWRLVVRLSRLLPRLAAQLLLVFRQRGTADYPQVAQSALVALGDADSPTDLALRLDYRIEHILVDEFQDTAITQYELLDKLTRGWGEFNAAQPDAPRTLFIVGDAMQSIYAFRGANVGLLLKAQREGFNGVTLNPIVLTSNFRSQAGVVQWVNDTFAVAFPAESNPNLAQVSYSPATPVQPALETAAAELHLFAGDDRLAAEMQFICQQLQRLRATEPQASIAILGRSRTQLEPLLAAMKQAGLDYYAQDLDTLIQSPAVADLLDLCRVLANPADRLAAMALLRAPWCGLSLADLLAVSQAGQDQRYSDLQHLLAHASSIEGLSDEGRQRLTHVANALAQALRMRERLSLRIWIEQTWLALDGPAVAPTVHALTDIDTFLILLEEADAAGVGLDIRWLEEKLKHRYMAGGDMACPIQVMTIHKAKGLEFDHVFIPQIGRSTRGASRDLLLWEEYSDGEGNRAFLLAADDREKDAPTLYNFLLARGKDKSRQENIRLMYVAATRAIKRLILTGGTSTSPDADEIKVPESNSLLHTIWPAVAESAVLHTAAELPDADIASDKAARQLPRLHRLAQYGSLSVDHAEPLPESAGDNRPEPLTGRVERVVGTVIHRALEVLSGRSVLPEPVDEHEEALWRVSLQEHGLIAEELERALALVSASVARTLQSPEGQWLLSREHLQSENEWPIVVLEKDTPVQRYIDRTFVDKTTGVRWIIDYKSSSPAESEPVDAFLEREAALYSEQLRGYRDALLAMESRSVRCALFFTTLGKLHVLEALDRMID